MSGRDGNQLGCGHSIAAVVTGREGTSYCAECAEEPRRCTCQWPITLVDKRTGRERCAECGRDVDNPERDANQLAGGMLAAALRARGRHPGYLERAALDLAAAAERVDNNFMGNGVAFQRDALRYHIGFTRDEVSRSRGMRRRD